MSENECLIDDLFELYNLSKSLLIARCHLYKLFKYFLQKQQLDHKRFHGVLFLSKFFII